MTKSSWQFVKNISVAEYLEGGYDGHALYHLVDPLHLSLFADVYEEDGAYWVRYLQEDETDMQIDDRAVSPAAVFPLFEDSLRPARQAAGYAMLHLRLAYSSEGEPDQRSLLEKAERAGYEFMSAIDKFTVYQLEDMLGETSGRHVRYTDVRSITYRALDGAVPLEDALARVKAVYEILATAHETVPAIPPTLSRAELTDGYVFDARMTVAEAAQYLQDHPDARVLHEYRTGCYFSDIYRREVDGYPKFTYMDWTCKEVAIMGSELVDVYQAIPQQIVPVTPISDEPAPLVVPSLSEQITAQLERIELLKAALVDEITHLQALLSEQLSPTGEKERIG